MAATAATTARVAVNRLNHNADTLSRRSCMEYSNYRLRETIHFALKFQGTARVDPCRTSLSMAVLKVGISHVKTFTQMHAWVNTRTACDI